MEGEQLNQMKTPSRPKGRGIIENSGSFQCCEYPPSEHRIETQSPQAEGYSQQINGDSPDRTDIFSRMKWQDWAFVLILIVLVYITYGLVSGFQQLPSPLYGGDVYFHFGVITHICTGNFPWMHNHFLDEYAHYPWIMHLLVAIIAWITGMQILNAAIYFPIVTTILSATVAYLLGVAVFKNRSIALIYSLFWATFQVPHTAASPFAELVVFPLFLLLLVRADDSLKSRIMAGIGFGLCGLGQVITWIGGIMTLVMLFAWNTLSAHIGFVNGELSAHLKGMIQTAWKQLKWFLPIGLVGLPIALLFWGPPLFIYQGVTPNNWSEYVSLGPKLTPAIIFDAFRSWYFNTDTWMTLVFSLGTLIGLLLAIRSPRRFPIPMIVGLVPIIGMLHPLIKEVGIGFYAFGYIQDAARGLLFFTTVYVVYKSLGKNARLGFYALVAVFLVLNAQATFNTFENDRWTQVGKTPNPQYDLAKWIMANTPLDAVFLSSHEETGFALNAMTGRKVVLARRTHASPFVDVNQRAADAAIIYWGKNETQIAELIKKYHIKYIYDDFYSLANQGECYKAFDLMSRPEGADASLACLRTSLAQENYIKEAGISYVKVHNTRLDPASNQAPRFDMIAIVPGNLSAWLINHTRIIKQVSAQGGVYQVLSQVD